MALKKESSVADEIAEMSDSELKEALLVQRIVVAEADKREHELDKAFDERMSRGADRYQSEPTPNVRTWKKCRELRNATKKLRVQSFNARIARLRVIELEVELEQLEQESLDSLPLGVARRRLSL